MIPTVSVTCRAFDQNGNPVAGARYLAQLDVTEIYQGFVVPETIEAFSDENGVCVLNLWPNELGVAGSGYVVRAWNPDTGRQFLNSLAVIPNNNCDLDLVVVQAPYPTIDTATQAIIAAQSAVAESTFQAQASATSAAESLASQNAAAASETAAHLSELASEASAVRSADSAAEALDSQQLAAATEARINLGDLDAAVLASGNSATAASASAASVLQAEINAENSATAASISETNATVAANAATATSLTLATDVAAANNAANTAITAKNASEAAAAASALSETVSLNKAAEALASATLATQKAAAADTSAIAAEAANVAVQGTLVTAAASAADALAHKNAAASSAADSLTSATASAGSESAVAASATAAAGSAAAALTSKNAAAASATLADTKAVAASASQASALTHEGNAAASATLASSKATQAGNSATAALTSQNAAGVSATNASNSAISATGSANTATTAAASVASGVTSAAASATAASNSATAAAGSATTASDKADIATTKAAEAAASAASVGTIDPSNYLPLAGGALSGHVTTVAGAAGNQVPRANEVLLKTGGVATGHVSVPANASGAQVPQAQEVALLATTQLAGNRNRMINGCMRVDQRYEGGLTAIPALTTYPVDRWLSSNSTGTGALTGQKVLMGNSTAVKVTATAGVTNLTANNFVYGLSHIIEAQNVFDLNGKACTLSFKVVTNWSGNLAIGFRSSDNARTFVTNVPVVSGANNISVTVPLETATVAASNSGVGIQITIGFNSEGSFRTATADLWQAGTFFCTAASTQWAKTSGNYITVGDVQFEEGIATTPFERRSYGAELSLCQRYFERISGVAATTFAGNYPTFEYRTTKRTTPTITITALAGGSGVVLAPTTYGPTVSCFQTVTNTVGSNFAAWIAAEL